MRKSLRCGIEVVASTLKTNDFVGLGVWLRIGLETRKLRAESLSCERRLIDYTRTHVVTDRQQKTQHPIPIQTFRVVLPKASPHQQNHIAAIAALNLTNYTASISQRLQLSTAPYDTVSAPLNVPSAQNMRGHAPRLPRTTNAKFSSPKTDHSGGDGDNSLISHTWRRKQEARPT